MKIRIVFEKEIDKEINEILGNADKGIVKGDDTLLLTPHQAAGLFTPRRLELLHYIAKNPHINVSEIAEILQRDWKSVLRDLKYLEGFGLVELVKEGRHRIVDIVSTEQVMAFT
jgi:predicted transcriptional regulator